MLQRHATDSGGAEDIEFRSYRPGDERRVIELFQRVFGRTMGPTESHRHWDWEYRHGPWGPGIVRLGTLGGSPVTHFAAIPRLLSTPYGPRLAAISVDSMSAAEARGRGAFVTVAKQAHSELLRQGIQFLYGFPNSRSSSAYFHRLSWVRSPELRVFARLHAWPAGTPGPPPNPHPRIGADEPVVMGGLPEAAALDRLWRSARPVESISVDRCSSYMSWRYRERPEAQYHYVATPADGTRGLAIGVCERRFGMTHGAVLECLAAEADEAVFVRLMASIERELVHRGAQVITCLAGGPGRLQKVLRRRGYVPVPSWALPHRLDFGVGRSDLAPLDPWMSPRRWYITWGDTDLL